MKTNGTVIVELVKLCSVQLMWALLAMTLLSGTAAQGAELRIVRGSVEVGRGQPPAWGPAQNGQELSPGDRIRTGHGSQAEISLETGTVRLYSNSMLHLPGQPAAKGRYDTVTLERGKSLFDVLHRLSGKRFEVHTPEVVVSVKGTRFSVDLTGELASVAVFRGTVGVRELGAELSLETLVREGFAATGGPGIPFELELAPEIDPWERWERSPSGDEFSPGDLERPGDREQESLSTARETARRVSSEDVLKHAIRRNPDVAARLRELVAKKKVESRVRRQAGEQASPPAAPAPRSDSPMRRRDRARNQPPPAELQESLEPGVGSGPVSSDWNEPELEPQAYPPDPFDTDSNSYEDLPEDMREDLSFNWGSVSRMLSNPNSELIPALTALGHSKMETIVMLDTLKDLVFEKHRDARTEGVTIDSVWVEETVGNGVLDLGWNDEAADLIANQVVEGGAVTP